MTATTDATSLDLTTSFPPALAADVRVVQERLTSARPPKRGAPGPRTVQLSTGPIELHEFRRSFDELVEPSLTPTQQQISHCLHTQHLDGYLRERHLRAVVTHAEEWVCPFVVNALGDLVLEVAAVVVAHLDQLDARLYAEFIARNPVLVERVTQRALSYWDIHYRGIQHDCRTFAKHPTNIVLTRFGVGWPKVRRVVGSRGTNGA